MASVLFYGTDLLVLIPNSSLALIANQERFIHFFAIFVDMGNASI
jgi:hypothetical protein